MYVRAIAKEEKNEQTEIRQTMSVSAHSFTSINLQIKSTACNKQTYSRNQGGNIYFLSTAKATS